ncbi:Acetyltransferase [Penicillium macrosclerotiorum]|uniref:Acetyltransferase n=1 Tax=Penicillium macrosclerotiorum TaxID=303699 RepID=UPI0025479BA2|nr:Acetyltransferase [Penicillium macrosclerotiorum]KAJ5690268.1 Acetyltransferase [Penicillium macrosclerotiorum]
MSSMDDPDGELTGTISFVRTSKTHLSTEIGFIVILPPYQRTYVAMSAVGLALQYALEAPENGGLGLRRVHWRTSTTNVASAKLAEKMGFEQIGIVSWHMRFVKGKNKGKVGNGKDLPPGSDPQDLWRDTIDYSLSWDRWETFAREEVQKQML